MKVNKKRFGFGLIAILLIIVLNLNILFAQVSINNSEKVEKDVLDKLIKNPEVQVIIKLQSKNDTIRDSVLANLSGLEFKLKEKLLREDAFVGNITKEGLDKLIKNPEVRLIYLNKIWHISLQESLPLINADDVWNDLGYTGKGQTICVIDTGINYSHSDLGGCTEAQFLAGTCSKVLGGYDYYNIDNNPIDDNGHGTHVAGIIAAKGTINGTAPDAKLIVMKVCNSAGTSCPTSAIENALTWCTNNKSIYDISVISMSIGGGKYIESNCPNDARDEINDAYSAGISVIISSGNNGYIDGISWPACRGNATSVGAVYDANVGSKSWNVCTDSTTSADKIVCFTNRASNLDILAPGSVINSTDIGGGYSEKSGTSMACPHVSGAVALLLEKDPTLTPDEIEDALKNSSKYIYDGCDDCSKLTFPRLDVLHSINSFCTCTNWTSGSCGNPPATACLKSEREYTRTCTPSACDTESKCEYDISCDPAGQDITVCASGCDYTSIQTAIDSSGASDKIYVKDDRSYNENIHMNSTTPEWLICENGSRIYETGNEGIKLTDVSSPVIVGCIIDGFDYGIYVDGSTDNGLIQNNTIINNDIGIYFRYLIAGMKIKYNNITGSTTYGINFDGATWANSAVSDKIENNILKNNGNSEIYMNFGQTNSIEDNNISEGDSYGIFINGNGNNINCLIQNNFIYNNANGVYLNRADYSTINTNIFCVSNTNVDITDINGVSTSGDNNKCEKPGLWNDSGTTGCTSYCDSGATSTLLYPPNNFVDTDGNIGLVCQAEDNYKLVNVTLYHNITGTWQANQTKNISGTSNITTFIINNILNGTIFKWNCLAYDNRSRGGFASLNWSVNVSIPPDNSPSVTLISPADNSVDEDGIVTFNCSATDDNNLVNITLYGNWTGTWHANETKSLTGLSNSTTFTKSLSDGVYEWSCLAYDNASQGGWADANWTINVSIIPDDTHKFYHKNSSGDAVAWLGSEGNIVLKGSCFFGMSCATPGSDSFIIKNTTHNNVAYVNSTGDLCISTGDCSDQSANCDNDVGDSFIVRENGVHVIYLDSIGDLCLKGSLYENSNP